MWSHSHAMWFWESSYSQSMWFGNERCYRFEPFMFSAPCRVLGLGVRLSRAFGPFPNSLEDAARFFLGIVSRFCRGGRRRLSQWLGSEWIGTTLDPTHETAYRARSHLVSEVFCVSKVIRDFLPRFTSPPPGFNLVGKRDQLALEWFPWHLRTYFQLFSL